MPTEAIRMLMRTLFDYFVKIGSFTAANGNGRECIQRTRRVEFGVGYLIRGGNRRGFALMDACKLACVKAVLGVFPGKSGEDVAGLLGAVVTKGSHGEHHAGEGS